MMSIYLNNSSTLFVSCKYTSLDPETLHSNFCNYLRVPALEIGLLGNEQPNFSTSTNATIVSSSLNQISVEKSGTESGNEPQVEYYWQYF